MNYSIFLIQILENPSQKSFENNILLIQMRAKCFEKTRKNSNLMLTVNCWINQNSKFSLNYNRNDFLIVEGYLSNSFNKLKKTNEKQIYLLAVKIYPQLIK